MRVGIKTWSSNGLKRIKELSDVSDFIELMPIKKSHILPLKKLGIEWTIHSQHETMRMNPADKSRKKQSIEMLNKAIYAADKLNAKFIIVHAGKIINKNCSVEQALNFFEKFRDNRILIENNAKNSHIVNSPKTIKDFTKRINAKICLDFSHAQIASVIQGNPYRKFLNDFMKLKPSYFHISDGRMGSIKDYHWNLGKGNFDISYFKKLIGNKPVALETNFKSSVEEYRRQISYLRHGA